jgi:hypothetical protein
MHIFVLTATYELRVSRKCHLRDHPKRRVGHWLFLYVLFLYARTSGLNILYLEIGMGEYILLGQPLAHHHILRHTGHLYKHYRDSRLRFSECFQTYVCDLSSFSSQNTCTNFIVLSVQVYNLMING